MMMVCSSALFPSVLFLIVVIVSFSVGWVSADQGDPTIGEFFRLTLGRWMHDRFQSFFSSAPAPPLPPPPQPVHVIAAGLPRTGTASFVVAMQKLGLKTYHFKDGAVETPGHLDLWFEKYNDATTSSVSIMDKILDDMAAKGFNATSDGPACFWYREQMKRYPNAKVVLTVRGDGNGEAWKRSFELAIIDVMKVVQDVPFCWFSMFQMIHAVASAMLVELGTDTDPDTGYPVVDQLPDAYDRWVQTVQATVRPKSKLLVHAAQHGWEPLCNHISSISPEVSRKCDEILKSGEPYPFVNDKAKLKTLIAFLRGIVILCKLSPLLVLIVGVIIGWRVRRSSGSAASSSTQQIKAKRF